MELAKAYYQILNPNSNTSFLDLDITKEEALNGLRKLAKISCEKAMELLEKCFIPEDEKLFYRKELAFLGDRKAQEALLTRMEKTKFYLEKPLKYLFSLTNLLTHIE